MTIQKPERHFQVELALGRARQPNNELMSSVFKYGSNELVSTAEDGLLSQGGPFIFPSSPQRVRIRAGGNVADDTAGLGAQEIEIFGINGAGEATSEIVTTAGVSASAWTTNTWWRVYRIRPTVVGEYDGVNTGDIDIENETDLDLLIQLPALRGSTLYLAWATGINQQALVSTLTFSVASNKTADIRIYTRENLTSTGAPYTTKKLRQEFLTVPSGLFSVPREPYLYLPPLTDVFVTAQVPVTTSAVSGALSIIVVPA